MLTSFRCGSLPKDTTTPNNNDDDDDDNERKRDGKIDKQHLNDALYSSVCSKHRFQSTYATTIWMDAMSSVQCQSGADEQNTWHCHRWIQFHVQI
jgi:hypothetical protein